MFFVRAINFKEGNLMYTGSSSGFASPVSALPYIAMSPGLAQGGVGQGLLLLDTKAFLLFIKDNIEEETTRRSVLFSSDIASGNIHIANGLWIEAFDVSDSKAAKTHADFIRQVVESASRTDSKRILTDNSDHVMVGSFQLIGSSWDNLQLKFVLSFPHIYGGDLTLIKDFLLKLITSSGGTVGKVEFFEKNERVNIFFSIPPV